MHYVLIGAIGFLIAYAFDWASIKRLKITKWLIGISSASLLMYAIVMVCISQPKIELPLFVMLTGSLLLLVALYLFFYSLFIEIPFHSTYIKEGTGSTLITTGTYALVRHPGVLWLGLFFLALSLIFPSITLFTAVIIWFILDVVYVYIQEKWFFPRMFLNYGDYQRQTPFLIPTRTSLKACLQTLRSRKLSSS